MGVHSPTTAPAKATGRPHADDRRSINGILYVLRTNCRWKDMPRRYGSPVTYWCRLGQCQEDGTWERVWRTLLATLDEQGKLDWSRAFLDGSLVPAKKGGQRVGLTRRGKGSKLMLVVENQGIPIGGWWPAPSKLGCNWPSPPWPR